MKILIVDDDLSNLSLLTTLLEKNGYAAVSAFNGEEALQKLRSEKFDLIITDILMPVMDGFKLAQTCKEDDRLKHIPIIICTGTYIDEKDETLALKFGAEAYLKKPYDGKTLIQTLQTVLDNVQSGKIKTDKPLTPAESGVYKLYSERLVNKLEKKMQELDKEKMALEMEVAQRKKIEDRLRKSRDYAESLLKILPAIVVIMDTEGRILRLNPYMEKISGYKLEEVQGKNWNEIFSPEDSRKSITDLAEGIHDSRAPIGNLSSIMTKEGDRREIVWYDKPLKDNDEKVIGLLAIGQDITDRLVLQNNLFQAKKFEAIGSFAGGIAHDFNSLLTLILGNVSMLEEYVEAGPDAAECIDEAIEASLRAKEMASRLMLFSKGRDPVKIASPVGALVWDAVSSAVRGFKIQCEFDIPEKLWPAAIDPWLIKHALHNVALNAVEAMKGRGSLKVSCENIDAGNDEILKHQAGRYIKISIKDLGPGIAAENLSKVFDPDFSTKDKGTIKGLGLGLAVVYSIIEKHEGVIDVTSEPGAGATVTIHLPVSAANGVLPEKPFAPAPPQHMASRGEKILVMDDEEPLRRMFKKMLALLGYDPVVTGAGDETVKAFQKAAASDDPFDAVIIDMTHKFAISGEDTIQKLREINPDAKLVICTGYPNDPIAADFKAQGFSGVLIKPFLMEDLGRLLAGIFREK